MPLTCAAACAILVSLLNAEAAFGIIDPKFTPVHLVRQSETIRAGTVAPAAKADAWTFTVAETLKGRPARECTLSVAAAKKDQVEELRKVLAQAAGSPVVLFSAEQDGRQKGYLSAAGMWLEADSADGLAWDVLAFAPKLSPTWAGGSDMLLSVARYVLAEPSADVPAAVGAAWMQDPCIIGKVDGSVCGLAAVDLPGDARRYLFVGSDKGDRLFRARRNDEAFEDATAAAKVDSRSLCFAWADVTGDGRIDLVTWDGRAIRVREIAPDGAFKPAEAALDVATEKDCLGLAPCSLPDGAPALLVSTRGTPVLLSLKDGHWTRTALPRAEADPAEEALSACIVADLNNDGFADVVQPRAAVGLLWKGSGAGFEKPVASKVCCKGEGRFALGDFNQDGFLDIFTSGPDTNELWENDGNGAFRAVSASAGSLGYRCAPGVSDCRAADVNHDGRADLCLLYAGREFAYHFNRGFRCFGEEGELRLSDLGEAGKEAPGQRACAVADFNGDGSLDLAVAFVDGRVACFYNSAFSKPILRVGLKKGVPGPVTVSAWQGEKFPLCVGAWSVPPAPAKVDFTLHDASEVTLKWTRPGKPPCIRKIQLPEAPPEGGIDVEVE